MQAQSSRGPLECGFIKAWTPLSAGSLKQGPLECGFIKAEGPFSAGSFKKEPF